ncbi:hypothetical protein [Sphingomicrobium nitratireducens]|uniref:hypothetical protein n=1 Tax=Sphingomicrobium nitratireducens TaxID=2964666 RepID=UPI00223FF014|nr:hypothetical protein [Sphingomicrobium nitratireducens]
MTLRTTLRCLAASLLLAGATLPLLAQDNVGEKYDKPGTVALRDILTERVQNRAYELKGEEVRYRPERDTVDTLAAYGRALEVSKCLVEANRVGVEQALAMRPLSSQEQELFAALFTGGGNCGSPTTTVLALQRGMLSEAAYLAAHPDQVPLPRNVDSAAVARFVDGEVDWNAHRIEADSVLIGASNCLVMTNPAIADLLARTVHGSDDETIVMDALFNAAPQCAGRRPDRVSTTFLRAFVMDALYRAHVNEEARLVFLMGG